MGIYSENAIQKAKFNFYLTERYNILNEEYITEADESRLKNSINNFIEDSNSFIDKTKESSDKESKLSHAWGLLTIGLGLISPCIAISCPIAGLITGIGSLISCIITIIHISKSSNDYKKLEGFKSKLLEGRSRTNNDKDRQRINDIIARIDHEIDIHYKNKPKERINYNVRLR